jgi:hypothetical protein
MNETFLKTFLRMGVMIALRIPLRIAGGWLLTKGYVEASEWETFGMGAGLVAVDLTWYVLERRGVLKALAQKDAIIGQQESRIMQQIVALQDHKELVSIALDLPHGSRIEDALAIQQNAKEVQ